MREQIAKNESKTFWTYPREIDSHRDNIERDKALPGFITRLGVDPDKISCITFVLPKKPVKGKAKNRAAKITIKIRTVPDIVLDLQRFSDEFEQDTNYRLPYRGESLSILTNRAVMELMVTKRKYITPAVRQIVSERCKGKCALWRRIREQIRRGSRYTLERRRLR